MTNLESRDGVNRDRHYIDSKWKLMRILAGSEQWEWMDTRPGCQLGV